MPDEKLEMTKPDPPAVVYKIVVLGDTYVGKTAIINSLVGKEFSKQARFTVFYDFVKQKYDIDGVAVELQIWDMAGQERFASLTRSYTKGAKGVVLVYDMTNHESLDILDVWLKHIEQSEKAESPVPVILLGNKVDLLDERQVKTERGEKVARRECMVGFFETSAVTGKNIAEAFLKLAKLVTEIHNPLLMDAYQRCIPLALNRKSIADLEAAIKVTPTESTTKETRPCYGARIIWVVLWFLTLIFVSVPVSLCVIWLYLFVLPLAACIGPMKRFRDSLYKMVRLPATCATNMTHKKPMW